MPHPKDGYRTLDGKRCAGTTTIIGRFKESGALIRWAYNRGKEGEELYESRDKAAEAGTSAHDLCEAHIKGEILIENNQPQFFLLHLSLFQFCRQTLYLLEIYLLPLGTPQELDQEHNLHPSHQLRSKFF